MYVKKIHQIKAAAAEIKFSIYISINVAGNQFLKINKGNNFVYQL